MPGRKRSRPVSRVLCVLRRDSHSSRPGVTARLQQPTRERRGPRHGSLIWSCSGWGLPCRATLAPHAVRSYRTLSPLPDPLAGPSAVCSLLHWPSAHAAQVLPGTLPYGARTFLDTPEGATRLSGRLHRELYGKNYLSPRGSRFSGGPAAAGTVATSFIAAQAAPPRRMTRPFHRIPRCPSHAPARYMWSPRQSAIGTTSARAPSRRCAG